MTRDQIIAAGRGSKAWLAFAFLCFTLGACQTVDSPAPVISIEQPLPPVPVPTIAPTNMRDVTWKVYNTAELEALVTDLKKKGDEKFVIIALTPKGYENLSLNMSELERYIREQKKVTLYLKKIIDERSKPKAK